MSDFLLDDSGQVRETKYRSTYNSGGISDSVAAKRASVANHNKGAEGNGGAAVSGAAASSLKVRPRTKYEQSIMDRIPQRQKDNLMQPQVFGGKVYTGIGFLPNPAKIQFLDFAVGDTIKQTLQLTNVSQGFNAFKVLPPAPLFRNVLEVSYTPQSMMSAGMSCLLTVIFTPKENVDIDTEIVVHAQTGYINIPVVCRRKKVVISASAAKLDFGSVVVADESTRSVTIKNSGALGVKMTIGGDLLQYLPQMHVDSDGNERPFVTIDPEISMTKPTVVTLRPDAQVTVTVRFAPLQICEIDSNLFLSFDNDEVEDIVVFVKGRSIDVPVFVSKNNQLEFDCCFYGTLYRDSVTVQNTLSSAVKVTPEVPAALKGMLEFVPKFAFVQPSNSLDFQVKFTPNTGAGVEVDAAVKLVVTDQAMPIFFQIKASLSHTGMTLSPPELQLGVCTLGEMLQLPLKITSKSRIAKRLAFVKVPANVRILPFEVFNIGPEETVEVLVACAPPTQGQFTQTLQLRSQFDEVATVSLTGHGKPQVLAFDAPLVKLPVCAIGQTVSATTILTNRSTSAQRFAFSLNAGYGMTISPTNGTIEKGASLPVVVTFRATLSNVLMELPPPSETPRAAVESASVADDPKGPKAASPAQAKKKSKAEEEQERREKERLEEERRLEREREQAERARMEAEFAKLEPWESSEESVEGVWSRHRSLLVPCYVENWSGAAILLGVRVTCIKPAVSVTAFEDSHNARSTPPVSARSALSQQQLASSSVRLDYGEVPADHTIRKKVLLTNSSSQTAHLSVAPVDPFSPFRVVCPPLATLRPGQSSEMTIEFKPSRKAVYVQNIYVETGVGSVVTVEAIGEGLPAALAISLDKAANATSSNGDALSVNCGFVLLNDRVDIPVYFTNFSPFPLHVVSSFIAKNVQPFNANGVIPFSISPKQVVIPANGKVEVLASFSPSSDGPYSAKCEVEFGGDSMRKYLLFEGYGCDKGLQVIAPLSEHNRTTTGPFTAFGDLPPVPGSSPSCPILLDFVSSDMRSASQVVQITNARGSSNGEFTIEGLADADVKNGWKVDPVKASVVPGSKANVTVSFTPTQWLLDSLPIPKVSVISVCNVKIVLKGGTPASDSTVYVRCKGTACR